MRVVTDLLKVELGFNGLVMTDDLDMGAIINEVGFAEAISGAVTAGNHLAMICHRIADGTRSIWTRSAVFRASCLIQHLSAIAEIKRHLAPPTSFSEEAFDPWMIRSGISELRCLGLSWPSTEVRTMGNDRQWK